MRSFQSFMVTKFQTLKDQRVVQSNYTQLPNLLPIFCPLPSALELPSTWKSQKRRSNYLILRRSVKNDNLNDFIENDFRLILPISDVPFVDPAKADRFLFYEIVRYATSNCNHINQIGCFGLLNNKDLERTNYIKSVLAKSKVSCLHLSGLKLQKLISSFEQKRLTTHEFLITPFIVRTKFFNLTRPEVIYDDYMLHAILASGGRVCGVRKIRKDTPIIKLSKFHGYKITDLAGRVVTINL